MKMFRGATPVLTPQLETTVVLIRHASTDAVGVRLAGRTIDCGLDTKGAAETRDLVAHLRDVPLSAIYSSPRRRARETAAAIAAAHQVGIVCMDVLDEVDFGDWSGVLFGDLTERDDWRLYNQTRSSASVPGGESPHRTQARAAAALAELHARHRGGVVAAVTHAEIIRYAILLARGRSIDEWMSIEVPTASATVLSCDAANVREMDRKLK